MSATNDLIINCDGSAIGGRGKIVGCAGIVKYPDYCEKPDEIIQLAYNMGTCTNMEILSILNSIKWVNGHQEDLKSLGVTRIIIYNDCDTVVDICNKWVFQWVSNGWKRNDGGDIKNLSTWKEYYREQRKMTFPFEIHWVKGKKTEERKAVDKLAKLATHQQIKKVNFNYIPVKQGRTLTKNKFILEDYNASGQQAIIRVYFHSIINRTKGSDYEIRFEEIDDKFQVVGRYRAYASKEIDRAVDRGHFYKAKFNDRKPPFILDIRTLKINQESSINKKVKSNM
ncbi:MAG: ribonuclease H [Parcubacteria group bacterium ADurb.Bin115]|nr:MAG: ribonuclease H [Parcubacteria group bacterium ADurb.Bin115]